MYGTLSPAQNTKTMAKSSAGCTMYFIRHGEKPAEGEPNVNGLSKQGEKRAQFIAKLFNGSNSNAIGTNVTSLIPLFCLFWCAFLLPSFDITLFHSSWMILCYFVARNWI